MDLEDAIRRIQEAKDVDPLSDVLIEALGLISALRGNIRNLQQRVSDLEFRPQVLQRGRVKGSEK